ncbi:TrkH family potassium uptake protein [Shimia abyssi]|uniref:Trk system potassium uptake protein TrkH n=1 Tax=Shimia abyssi TaxID=1662395 RepID=A0A2P8F6J2_9RHOB|nr:potassium transporter TrkG [Shimia abyssi]PSL17336.1 trk system potassium uptake protein TrkH [Shimia abyssi]
MVLSHLSRFPLFLHLVAISGVLMFLPAILAVLQDDHFEARMFFYSAIFVIFVSTLIAMAISGTVRAPRTIDHLLTLFCAFAILPLVLALPFYEAIQTTSYLNAYFEMVSSLTTTGATLFEQTDRLPPALHLWRGIVGWMGGLMMWIAASAVFAPLSLGGFEVTTRAEPGKVDGNRGLMQRASPMKRWTRGAIVLVPIYAGLTLAIWVMLMILGDQPLSGLMHAMSTMSTSGISPVGGLENGGAGLAGEGVIFLFMLFALSRLTFSADTGAVRRDSLLQDPEFRMGLTLVLLVTAGLFLRHWVGAFDVNETRDPLAALRAAWGALFTVLSFLTTTGFQSSEWDVARDWSGLNSPGLILMGLALVGGGVATTAGGVKLLRVYALYLQGLGEMERLVHPSVVIGSRGAGSRRIRRRGAVLAWVFFMLFAISLAAVTTALAALGSDFEQALVLAIAALTTTGPLTQVAADAPIDLLSLANAEKVVLGLAMVLGRLETLAIIALMAPDLWHK